MPILLPLLVLVPLAAALLCLLLGRSLGRYTGWLMTAAALGCFGVTAGLHATATAEPLVFHAEWIPALNIDLRLRADGFGLFFALIISGIGALISIYSVGYAFKLPGERLGRYYAALSAFMAAMLGIALADDLMLLFVFWEITSVTSFLLIGFWYEYDSARRGALTALQVTALGGLAMLVGFVFLGMATGTFTLSSMANDPALRQRLLDSPLLLPTFLLILAGIFTKSAQVPFHFWLPSAMVAPTPVSTYLHAAAMVKAGVFLTGRMLPIFGDTPYWSAILVPVGIATFWLGAYQAFREYDLKAMLARTTVSTLGLILLVYGLGATQQDSVQILSHSLYKGALFLVVGIVEHAAHTRDLRELGGLRRALPITFVIAVVAAASMAGVMPLFGFLAKEALYAELLGSAVFGSEALRWLVITVVVASNGLLTAIALKLIVGVFFGAASEARGHIARAPDAIHENVGLWLPPAILAALALGLGLLGGTSFTQNLLQGFASAPTHHLHLSLWPHAGPLSLSLLSLALGVGLYRQRNSILQLNLGGGWLPGAQATWDAMIEATVAGAAAFSAWWQNGSLRWYFSVTLVFLIGVFAYALTAADVGLTQIRLDLGNWTWYGAVLCGLIVYAGYLVVSATTRLGAAIALTAVGFLVALLFAVYRSPDIVLTQIVIETVSTIFILLVLYFMPVFRPDGLSPGIKAGNVLISVGVGLVMFLLVLLSTSPGFRETNNLARVYLEQSLSGGGGSNAVNVIIVDLRAMDTTGEITVLVVVGLCIFGMLRARRVRA